MQPVIQAYVYILLFLSFVLELCCLPNEVECFMISAYSLLAHSSSPVVNVCIEHAHFLCFVGYLNTCAFFVHCNSFKYFLDLQSTADWHKFFWSICSLYSSLLHKVAWAYCRPGWKVYSCVWSDLILCVLI